MIPLWQRNLNRRAKQHKIAPSHRNQQYRDWRSELKRHKTVERRNRLKRAKKRNLGNQFRAA